ncbi:MAG: HNH endonuclease [Terriglobales bacterium]
MDIGDWAGGIGLLRGNSVLHAETYTDYHNTTLEVRRGLRRGRRTRRSKKMRLARLRSWILRQADPIKAAEVAAWRQSHPGSKRLPNNLRLPDPYRLMPMHCFQCQPTEYKRKIGPQKLTLPTWVEAAKDGKLPNGMPINSDAFVIALTHLFQKRGFAWEGSDLSEMTDKELAQELKTVRLTETAAQQLRTEIERRKQNPEPEREGKIADFEKQVAQGLARPKQSRVAEHRSVVEGELQDIVRAFTRSCCGEEAETVAASWCDALVRILNKPIRPARFENRVISGCSWCSKNTPRKYKVRRQAFAAALRNIRTRLLGSVSGMLLNDEQRKPFLELFGDEKFRAKIRKAREDKFRKMLGTLKAQEEMAKQLAELTGDDKPKGRTNLCQQHLELAGEGAFLCSRHGAICKIRADGVSHEPLERVTRIGPAVRITRNPCREAHDKRLIQRIEEILFDKNGKPRHGALPSLITLEFPKPNVAQTLRCPYCNEKVAADLQLRFKVRKLQLQPVVKPDTSLDFKCPNETCSRQADGNLLRLTAERRRFINGKMQWRHFSVPNNEAVLRKAVGGMKQKKKRQYLAETRECCVYCGTKLGLDTMQLEHIFPKSRGGPFLDYNLVPSCKECNPQQGDGKGGGKGNLTPWEWRGRDDADWWGEFAKRVSALPMPQRKKEILLSQDLSYPDNPTALARAGGRSRQFIEALKEMLIKHGIPPERIADNYERDKIVIQTIEGWTTSKLRMSWRTHDDGRENFPRKNDKDLHNHAQDAVVIAACPPHTWRESLFTESRTVDGKQVPGLAPQSLAPDWADFFSKRTKPLVRLLGRYDVSWRRGFMDLNFWRNRKTDTQKPIQRKLIAELKRCQAEQIRDKRIREVFKNLCRKYDVPPNKPLPDSALAELRDKFPGIRRVQYITQPGGLPLVIEPRDGPARVAQAKPGSEGAKVWLRAGVTLENAKDRDISISVLRPEPLRGFRKLRDNELLAEYEPSVPPDATVLNGEGWRRHEFILMHDGWWQLKEFSDGEITLLPENAIPKQLGERMGLENGLKAPERTLRKKGLLEYFRWRGQAQSAAAANA